MLIYYTVGNSRTTRIQVGEPQRLELCFESSSRKGATLQPPLAVMASSAVGSAEHAQRWRVSNLEKQLAEARSANVAVRRELEEAQAQVRTVSSFCTVAG